MAEEIGIVLSFKGADDFIKNLAKAQRQLFSLGKFVEDAALTLTGLENALKKAGQGDLAESFNTTKLISGLLESSQKIDLLGISMRSTADEFAAATSALDKTTQNLDEVGKQSQETAQELDKTEQALQDIAEQTSKLDAGKVDFSGVDFEKLENIDFTDLTQNIDVFVTAYERIGAVVAKYSNLDTYLESFFNTFNTFKPAGLTKAGVALTQLGVFFEQIGNVAGDGIGQAKEVVEFVVQLSQVKSSSITNLTKNGDKLVAFITGLTAITPGRLDKFTTVTQFLKDINQITISNEVPQGIKELTGALTDFITKVAGKLSGESITNTVEALKQFEGVIAILNAVTPELDQFGNAVTQTFGAQLVGAGKQITEFVTSLKAISSIQTNDFAINVDALSTGLQALFDVLLKGSLASDTFVSDIKNIGTALDSITDAAQSLGRSTKTITAFSDNAEKLRDAFNTFTSGLDTKKIIEEIIPFESALKSLSETVSALNKFTGSKALNKIASVDIAKEKTAVEQLKNERQELIETTKQGALALSKERLEFNKSTEARRAERDAIAAITKQRKIDAEFLQDSLKRSGNILDNFIAKWTAAADDAPSLKMRIEVLGIKAATRFISLFTVLPIKAVGLFVKLLGKLSAIIAKLGVGAIVKGFRLLGGVIAFGAKAILSLLAPIGRLITMFGQLTLAILKLPFKLLATTIQFVGNVIKGTLNLFLNLALALGRVLLWAVKLVAKVTLLTAAFKVLVFPIKLLIGLFNSLGTAVQKLAGTMRSSGTDKANKELNEFSAETREAAAAQNALQVELSQTDKELLEAQRGAQKTTNALQGLNLAASGVNLAKTFAASSAITKSIKGIVGFTLAFKALQKATQLVGQAFQQLRFHVQNLVGGAVQAAAEYENLRLTLTALSRVEIRDERLGLSPEAIVGLNDLSTAVDENVESLLEWIRVLAIQSPFQETAVARLFQFAQSMGFATDQAKILTQTTVDWAAGNAKSAAQAESVILALGQISQGLSVTKEDLTQLRTAGFGKAFQELANVFTDGDQAAFLDELSAGAIPAKEAVAVLNDVLQRDFAGSAKAATNTISGLLSSFDSLREGILRNAVTPTIDLLKPLAGAFLEADNFNLLFEQATAFGEILAEKVLVVVTKAIQIFGAVKAIWDSTPDSVKALGKQLLKFVAIMGAVVVALTLLKVAVAAAFLTLGILVNPLSIAVGALVAFGSTIRSVVGKAIPTLQKLGTWFAEVFKPLEPGLLAAQSAFTTTLNNIANMLSTFTTTVFNYGANIGTSFANGIVSAVGAVVDAIGAIASTIAFWLAPGSPPRAIPNIDQWGTDAANEFLDGFTDADFGLIQDFGGTIDDLVAALELDPASIDTNDIQRDFADLIAALNSGNADDSSIQTFVENLRKETGEASVEFENLANEYVKLAQEQATLNTLTDEYNASLRATNSELDELSRQEAFIDQQNELDNLTRTLTSRFSTTEAKEKAEIRRKQILAEQDKAAIEAQQANVDEQQEAIDLLKQRIALDKEQSDAFAEPVAGAGAGAGGLGDKLGKIKDEKLAKVDEIVEALGEGLSDAITPANNLKTALDKLSLDPDDFNIGNIFAEAQEKITLRIDAIKDKFDEMGITVDGVKKILVALGIALGGAVLINKLAALSTALGILLKVLRPFILIGAAGAGSVALVGGALVLFADKVTPENLDKISEAIRGVGDSFIAFGKGYKEGLQGERFGTQFESLEDFFTELTTLDAETFGGNVGATVDGIRTELLHSLTTLGTNISEDVETYVLAPFRNAFLIETTFLDERDFSTRILDGIKASLTTVGTAVTEAVKGFITANIFAPFEGGVVGTDGTLGEKILAGIQAVFAPLSTQLGELIDTTAIGTAITENIIAPFVTAFTETDLTEDARTFVGNIVAGIQNVLAETNIVVSLKDLITFDSAFLEPIKTAFASLRNAIPTNILDSFLVIWNRFTENLAGSELGPKLAELAQNLLLLGRNVLGVVAGILGLAAAFLAPIFAELPSIFGNILDVINGVLGFVNDLVDAVIKLASGDVTGAIESLQGAFDNVILAFEGVLGLFEDAANAIITAVVAVATVLGIEVNEKWIAALRGFYEVLATLPTLIQDAITKAILWVVGLGASFSGISTTVANFLTDWAALIETVATAVFSDPFGLLVDGITDTIDLLLSLGSNIITFAEDLLGIELFDPFEVIRTNMSDLLDFITDVITAVKDIPSAFTTLDGITTIDFTPFVELYDALNVIPEAVAAIELALNIDLANPFDILQLALDALLLGPDLLTQKLIDFLAYVTGYTLPNPFTLLREAVEAMPAAIDALTEKFAGFSTFLSNLAFENPFAGIGEGIGNLFGGDSETAATAAGKDAGAAYADGLSTATTTAIDIKAEDIVSVNEDEFKQVGVSTGAALIDGTAEGLAQESTGLANALTDTATAIQDKWNSVWGIQSPSTVAKEEMGAPIAEGIIEGIDETFDTEAPIIAQSTSDKLAAAFSETDTSEVGTSFVQSMIDGIKTTVDSATEGNSLLSALLVVDVDALSTIQTQFSLLFSTILKALTDFVTEFLDRFSEFIEELSELIEDMLVYIVEAVEETLANVIEQLVGFAVQAIQILSRMMSSIEDVMKRFYNIMKDAAEAGIKAFLDALDDFGDDVLDSLEAELLSIRSDLNQIAYDLGYGAGDKIAQGIEKAIRDAIDDIADAARAAVKEAVNAARDEAGIASPSKVFYDQVGTPLMAGLASGIAGGSSMVAQAARNVVSNTVNSARRLLKTAPLTLPINTKYSGIRNTLPALSQDVVLNRYGANGNVAGIADMRAMASTGVINHTNNYSMSMQVNERVAPKVRRNFSRMQQLKV